MIDDGDCGAIGGLKIGKGNRSTRRKPAPAPLRPPHIPHDQTRGRTRAAAVGSQRLTAWTMARPCDHSLFDDSIPAFVCIGWKIKTPRVHLIHSQWTSWNLYQVPPEYKLRALPLHQPTQSAQFICRMAIPSLYLPAQVLKFEWQIRLCCFVGLSNSVSGHVTRSGSRKVLVLFCSVFNAVSDTSITVTGRFWGLQATLHDGSAFDA
jgi:hypothetical protein